MWSELTGSQKLEYRKYCDKKFGPTIIFSEFGEPLYLDSELNLIDTSLIMELLFCLCEN